jgi:phosphatidylinositol alpha-1,6-mannosyltransferase
MTALDLRGLLANRASTTASCFWGVVARERLIEVYRMADLFIMPSTGEGFGIAFLEAMACGTPAVGLPFGGSRDALADDELGTLTTEAGLVDTLERLLIGPRAEPQSLSSAVQARFGYGVFSARGFYRSQV